jgi:biopolymer transport protein ExbD
MAKSAVFKRRGGAGDVAVNMTPMIDVTFQLIIFFIIASQFASQEKADLTLPFPHEPVGILEEEVKERRVVVNVLSAEDPLYRSQVEKSRRVLPGDVAWYVVQGQKIEHGRSTYEDIKSLLKRAYDAALEKGLTEDKFHVEIRADERVGYNHVATAMQAAGEVQIKKANISIRRTGEGE